MSHNTEPERAARRHPAPIIAIIGALVVAAVLAFWFTRSDPAEEGDLSRIDAPAEQSPATSDPAAQAPVPDQPAGQGEE